MVQPRDGLLQADGLQGDRHGTNAGEGGDHRNVARHAVWKLGTHVTGTCIQAEVGCRDLKGFAGNMFGSDVDEELTGVLGGHEVGAIVEMVKNSLNGGTSEQVAIMSRLTQEENDPNK